MKREEINRRTILDTLKRGAVSKHPNILIAAGFWEKDRFDAAKVCYRFMRRLDDFVDSRKSEQRYFSKVEKREYVHQINQWIAALSDNSVNDTETQEVKKTIKEFNIPIRLFHRFASSMIYDVNNTGFDTYRSFEKYAEGAAVSPASVFVHLCCLAENKKAYRYPGMDLSAIARPCALFSYIVHIIRDFAKDRSENLNYFSHDLLTHFHISDKDLENAAKGNEISEGFRQMIGWYCRKANLYQQETIRTISELKNYFDDRYLLSLNLIYNLYLAVFKRIDANHGTFSSEELNPGPDELQMEVNSILNFNPV